MPRALSRLSAQEAREGLAKDGRTVIISIHAPRSEIWSIFDNVVLLARGEVVYSGSVSGSLPHFEPCSSSVC